MKKEYTKESSTYHLRMSYLQALKRYMPNRQIPPEEQMYSNDIDAYFSYEKQFSSRLQALLKPTAHKPMQP